ncbi:MAG: GxxExxY protein [Terriglobia bacterium]|jgi:GxxExxY protein
MDEHDGQDTGLKHGLITHSVIGCAFEVINELGTGFLESVYEKALLLALRQKGLSVICQHPIKVMFRGECVGDFYADIFVEGKVIVELKAVKAIAPEHQAQVINYLNATGIEVGLLISFGNPKLEYKRFTRSKDYKHATTDPQTRSLDDQTVVGIDVGAEKKGFHAVALRNGAFATKASTNPAEIMEWCREQNGTIVAVDAPCGWSQSDPCRRAERELKLDGKRLFAFATPTRTKAHENKTGFYDWIFNGEKLYQQLAPHFPLFEGSRPEGPASFETFPHAIACALAGKIIPASASERRKLLTERGYDASPLLNDDFVDAALCALAADAFRQGRTQHFGRKNEGFIIVPDWSQRVATASNLEG